MKDNPSKAPWIRVVKIIGIYNSGFQEFDKSFVIGDIRHIQKMNRWEDDEVGGFEVLIANFDEIEEKSNVIAAEIFMFIYLQELDKKILINFRSN